LEVVAALAFVRTVTAAFTPVAGEQNRAEVEMAVLDRSSIAVNLEDRRLADFSEEDIAALQGGGTHP
jgi:hypothetical protein